MSRKKSLAEELAELANPAPAAGTGQACRVLPGVLRCRRMRHLPVLPTSSARCLSLLSLPAEIDPEADVFGAGPALVESDEELQEAAPRR